MGEICQRCGEEGEDRRTLWMACFYAMSELNVPFEQAAILGKWCGKKGDRTLEGLGLTVPEWAEPTGEERHHSFFTLRVCKDCRAEWMAAIEKWFHSFEPQRESCGSGIFIRDKGRCIEITEAEWYERQKARGEA